ncbi:metallophosphoesterase [Botrimarina sp.]|uniref:metallophosphoesterase n=1 Tax=Botrimarina sp. TaxID=2795802 RepID=UPI0032EED9AA
MSSDSADNQLRQVPQMSRRRWLRCAVGAGAAAAVGTGGYAWWIEPHWVAVRRHAMRFEGLPMHLVGKRLVQISDLHVGPIVDNNYLRRTLRRLASLQPDYLAITGDFMTCLGGVQADLTARTLREGPIADVPTVAVLGNHDYGETFGNIGYANRLADTLDSLGVRLLRNDSVEIDGLQFAGCGDLWGNECRVGSSLLGVEASRPAVYLAHNPDVADRSDWGDFRGWILAGHTHGGQCQFPFVGAPVLPVRNRRYCEGHIHLADGRDLYVNRGLGYKRRIRFGVRPEVTVFTLEQA